MALLALLAFLLFFDVSVATDPITIGDRTIGGGRVNNLGLMADRQNGIVASGFIALIAAAAAFAAKRRRVGVRGAIITGTAGLFFLAVSLQLTVGFSAIWTWLVLRIFGV